MQILHDVLKWDCSHDGLANYYVAMHNSKSYQWQLVDKAHQKLSHRSHDKLIYTDT